MLRERSTMTYSGVIIIDTPYRQTITNDILDFLCYSDYTVMELTHVYDFSINDNEKSMYRVTFSTITQWKNGDTGYVSNPPPKEDIHPVQRQMWEIDGSMYENNEILLFMNEIGNIDQDINIQMMIDQQFYAHDNDDYEEDEEDEDEEENV